ncbi:Oidioi.mRNA.OKI2018_I69.chr1.g1158.t1.cds [Oikopleura dioica]|uniref:Oidioi.mRNA.OKI2018_I69.chr1.g1158.t1.cds n=1 Tax=Oikopleura dioica TaxID=34765 RepID=A0ABN7SS38_OIKDI|nr:Oidioi.mRNA.OKI2018_I69.chr1.g1158.t1.cds [Oikopleura dioica]
MSGKIQLQRHVDLTSAVMIIVGAIVGSGIYISPKGILEHAGTSGYAVILWILSGLVASMGALCYAEVGALIPKSGGEYPVIFEAYGPICGFTFAWTCTTIIRPASLAIFTSAFAQLTKTFGYIKIASLVVIILLGFYGLIIGKGDLSIWQAHRAFYKNGESAFPEISHIGLGLYHGLWSYDGWNQLNYVVEEIKQPETNLLKAIVISLCSITGFYLLINFMYISILGVENILTSPAVATSYAQQIFPQIGFIVPIMVACSCLGAALVQGMTAARIPYSAAREGQMPVFLSMIHIDFLTPAPAVMLNGILASLLLLSGDINSLINYFSFCMWIFHTSTCFAIFIFRKTHPIDKVGRSFAVPLFIPAIIALIGSYLVLAPFINILQTGESLDLGYLFVVCWIAFGVGLFVILRKSKNFKIVALLTKKMQILLKVVAPD